MKQPQTPQDVPVVVDFVDGNAVWRETGMLRHNGRCFVLDVSQACGGGARVFPREGRDAVVYLNDPYEEDPVLITRGSTITLNRLDRRNRNVT